MIISEYFKLNNKKLIKKLKKYTKDNPCCDKFNKCTHPKYQSNPMVFNMKDIDIDKIKEMYFDVLFKTFNKVFTDIIENKCWVYLTYKNKNTESIWHNHESSKNTKNISGLLYLTPTKIGTEFKTEFLNFEIVPHINRWFLWESSIIHRPKKANTNEDRLVLATSTILKI